MTPIFPGVLASGISGHLFSPTGSYTSIKTATVTSGGTGTITFASIPQTFKHLQLRCFVQNNNGGEDNLYVRVGNGSVDTGNNYTYHALQGSGSSASSGGLASQNYYYASIISGNTTVGQTYSVAIMDILDYTNTNKNKTMRTLGSYDNNGTGLVSMRSSAWLSTSAIDTISLVAPTWTFNQYTQFALYGVN